MLDGRKERCWTEEREILGRRKKKENVHVTDEKRGKGSVGENEIKVVGVS